MSKRCNQDRHTNLSRGVDDLLSRPLASVAPAAPTWARSAEEPAGSAALPAGSAAPPEGGGGAAATNVRREDGWRELREGDGVSVRWSLACAGRVQVCAGCTSPVRPASRSSCCAATGSNCLVRSRARRAALALGRAERRHAWPQRRGRRRLGGGAWRRGWREGGRHRRRWCWGMTRGGGGAVEEADWATGGGR